MVYKGYHIGRHVWQYATPSGQTNLISYSELTGKWYGLANIEN